MNALTHESNGPPPPAALNPFTSLPAPPCGKLGEALSAVRDRCKAADKDSWNDYHKYHYASAEGILTEANRALEGSGLAVIPLRERLVALDCGNVTVYALD